MINKFRNLMMISLLVGLIFYLNSCNDQPVDIPLVSEELDLKAVSSDTLELIADIISEKNRLNVTFNLPYQFLGETEDGYKAISMIRYSEVPDSIPSIDVNDIVSAKMTLYPDRYYYGDTTNTRLAFEVRELLDTLKIDLTWDEIFNEGKTYFGDEVLGDHESVVMLKDTADADPFEFDIDKNIIKKWFEFAAIEDSTDDPYKFYSYSIALLPKENSGMNGLFRFDAYRPSDENDYSEYINDRELPKIEVIYYSNRTENILDTAYLNPVNTSYYIDGPDPEPNTITIQGGISIRSKLIFDLESIPKYASILRAEMQWTLDPERSKFGVFGPDSAVWGAILDEFGNFTNLWPYQASWKDSTFTFVFPSLGGAIERWNNLDDPGELTFIAPRKSDPAAPYEFGVNNRNAGGELYFLERYVFYGLDAEIGKRPKLLVIYTENPEDFE